MEHTWKVKATCIVPQVLIAVLLTVQQLAGIRHPFFNLFKMSLYPLWIHSMFAYRGYARPFRKVLGLYIVPLQVTTQNWQNLPFDMIAVWPTLLKLGIASGIILMSWQQLLRLRARVLL